MDQETERTDWVDDDAPTEGDGRRFIDEEIDVDEDGVVHLP